MELTVIIPAHDEERLLPQQLDAVLGQEWDGAWEVVVVDNGSTDGTAALVDARAARDARVRRVAASEKQGLAYARNAGVAVARGTSVAFCDADDVVAPGWLSVIGSAMRVHRFATGALELDALNPPGLAASRGRDDEHRLPTFHGLFPSAHGNNFAIERQLYLDVGGSDESIARPSAEDVDLSLRVWLAGVRLEFVPDAVVHYRYRTEPRELFRQGRAYGSCRPLVARRLHDATGLRPPRVAGWRSWAWLALNLPAARSADGRSRWAWVAGNRWGQLEGSARERFLLL